MAPRATPLVRPLLYSLRSIRPRAPLNQIRCASDAAGPDPSITDPNMNGGYVNPPPQKRALRDPYAGWWDEQERRNFGEPVHEDNDILTVFSPEPYRHASAGKAGLHFGLLIAAVLGLCGVVYQYYPDKPSVQKEYDGGLESELGGPGAWTAKSEEAQEEIQIHEESQQETEEA